MEDLRDTVHINFVYSECEKSVKDFLNGIPEGSDYINYLDIYNKLTKNDFYQCEPSDEVVTSYLIKELNASLSGNVSQIFYVISTLDKETLSNIKLFILSLTNHNIIFNIYHPSCVHLNGTSKLFNKSFSF